VPREFFDSAEYLRIAEFAQTLNDLIGPGAFIRRGDDKQEVASFKAAMTLAVRTSQEGSKPFSATRDWAK